MNVKTIIDNGSVIAHIYSLIGESGRFFPTPPEFPLQFGFHSSDDGWETEPHVHKEVTRNVIGTGEFIFIIKGGMTVDFYNSKAEFISTERFTKYMALLQIKGGHKISFDDNTAYFEVKQGPYMGKDYDKFIIKETSKRTL